MSEVLAVPDQEVEADGSYGDKEGHQEPGYGSPQATDEEGVEEGGIET